MRYEKDLNDLLNNDYEDINPFETKKYNKIWIDQSKGLIFKFPSEKI